MKKTIQIERFKNNPLIEPDQHHTWMSRNAFNCGVVIDNDGLYKMLFRGAWTEDQSMSDLGLATSVDGKEWYVLDKPVLKCWFNKFCKYGIDDPRIVKWIDGWKYIFAAICPSKEYRTAGIFRTKNFTEYEWVGMPFNLEDSNASIFPEPINGWAYLLHRKAPHIWISRTKDMSLKSGWQNSKTLIYKDQFYRHPEHDVLPDKIGIAGPPIRTPKGWLLITHVVHRWDKKITRYSFLLHRSYSLGFVVLDLEDPTKVLYIHPRAILWPEERHEIVGTVPNVVFSCATVDTGGDSLYIYWGGADTVICGGKLMKKDLVIKINGKGAPLFPKYH
ncbi:MAG: glycosidase [Deltaproteobacteria bacterium]|nr:glycosidase [Deltaproteobacteria bacterium]